MFVLNRVYTAADHFHDKFRPGVSDVKLARQVTGVIPPGNPAGAGRAAPARNTFPLSPVRGAVVCQVLVAASNVVTAWRASGVNVITAFGTATAKFGLVMVPPSTRTVVVCRLRPETLSTELNHTVLPAAIGVPLKLDVTALTVGTTRASSDSTGRGRRARGEAYRSQGPTGARARGTGETSHRTRSRCGDNSATRPRHAEADGRGERLDPGYQVKLGGQRVERESVLIPATEDGIHNRQKAS